MKSKQAASAKSRKSRKRTIFFWLPTGLFILACVSYIHIQHVLLTQALVHAIMQGNVTSAKLALDRGADPNALFTSASGWDGRAGEESKIDLLEALFGKQLHQVQRQNPLLLATLEGKDDIAQLLIVRGANVHFQDAVGSTALQWAAHSCNAQIVHLLVDTGADVNSRYKDGTPVISDANGRPEIIAILKQAGAKE